jgi:hypothetical protein
MIRIELEAQEVCFKPNGELVGTVIWEFPIVPKEVTLTLEWSTYGKGDCDSDICIEQTWEPTMANGKEPFRWRLPRGPVSLDGQLISLEWTLNACVKKPNEEFELPIVISHLPHRIALQRMESQLTPSKP